MPGPTSPPLAREEQGGEGTQAVRSLDLQEIEWDFSADDLDHLVSHRVEPQAEGAPAVAAEALAGERNEELIRLTRQIAGQYVEVLAGSLAQAFRGREGHGADHQLGAVLDNMIRLSSACGDDDLLGRLQRLQAILEDWHKRRPRGRQAFVAALREAVLGLAGCMGAEDGARLRGLVIYERRSIPLLDELAELPGIGVKRLDRLYSAGLFTVEVVGSADPDEIAQVTGLPKRLARDVVEATRSFAERSRRQAVEELQQRAEAVLMTIKTLRPDRKEDRRLLQLTRDTLSELQAALQSIGEEQA